MPKNPVPAAIEVLHLPAALAERIRDEARRRYPAEACGFLAGVARNGRATAHEVLPQENRAARRDRFLIAAEDVFHAMQAARAADREIIGVYHSHPDAGAELSATDRADAWGEWLHLIVACHGGEPADMRCWRPDGESVAPVPIRAEDS